MLTNNPGFTAIAVLTLALGIGANTAIFSVVDAVLIKRLSYPEPERVVRLNQVQTGVGEISISWPDFLDWEKQATSFSLLAADRKAHLALGGTDPKLIRVAQVTAPFFPLFGIKPVIGERLRKRKTARGRLRLYSLEKNSGASGLGRRRTSLASQLL
jgi:hypothetical protein